MVAGRGSINDPAKHGAVFCEMFAFQNVHLWRISFDCLAVGGRAKRDGLCRAHNAAAWYRAGIANGHNCGAGLVLRVHFFSVTSRHLQRCKQSRCVVQGSFPFRCCSGETRAVSPFVHGILEVRRSWK